MLTCIYRSVRERNLKCACKNNPPVHFKFQVHPVHFCRPTQWKDPSQSNAPVRTNQVNLTPLGSTDTLVWWCPWAAWNWWPHPSGNMDPCSKVSRQEVHQSLPGGGVYKSLMFVEILQGKTWSPMNRIPLLLRPWRDGALGICCNCTAHMQRELWLYT